MCRWSAVVQTISPLQTGCLSFQPLFGIQEAHLALISLFLGLRSELACVSLQQLRLQLDSRESLQGRATQTCYQGLGSQSQASVSHVPGVHTQSDHQPECFSRSQGMASIDQVRVGSCKLCCCFDSKFESQNVLYSRHQCSS